MVFQDISYQDLFTADLQEQYSNFFYYLKDVMNGDASLFYAFDKGLGGSMLGTFIYYLSSPFNLFLFFISKAQIPIFIVCLIFLKIGLSGLSMYIFLQNHFKEKNKMFLFFSFSYALMGYVMIYYFNIMWLDLVYLAPFVLLGLDRILEGKKATLYIVFLFLVIVSNCYLAFMLCIFCFLYFIYQLLLQKKKDKKLFLSFLGSSLFSVFLSSFLLIPFLFELMNVYRDSYGGKNSFFLIFHNFTRVFSSFFITSTNKQFAYWDPYLYFGIFNFMLVIFYFLNSKIKKRDKKITIGFLFFFLLSYSIPFINQLWHVSNPTVSNYRYSFLVTIFLLLLACQSFQKREGLKEKQLWIGFLFVIFVFVSSYFLSKQSFSMLFFINLFFLIGYFLLFKINIKYHNLFYSFALFLFLFLELTVQYKNNFVTNKSIEKSYKLYTEESNLCEILNQYSSFRMEGFVFNSNENLICHKGKISEFNTMNDQKIYNFFQDVGFEVYSSWINNYFENYEMINSLLGIKYFYSKEDLSDIYKNVDSFKIKNQEYFIYENENALSIGYAFEEHNKKESYKNNFDAQNDFLEYLTGIQVYYPLSMKKINKNTFEVEVTNDPIYFNYKNLYNLDLYMNDEKSDIQKKNDDDEYKYGNIYIENKYPNQTVTLRIESDYEIDEKDVLLYSLNLEKYKQALNLLKKESLNNIKIDKNKLSGDISLEDEKTLFLSIPYNSNFTVLVDGKQTKYRKLYDTFMGIDLEKGTHYIELVYFPKYIFIGIVISIFTCFFGIVYHMKVKKMSNIVIFY